MDPFIPYAKHEKSSADGHRNEKPRHGENTRFNTSAAGSKVIVVAWNWSSANGIFTRSFRRRWGDTAADKALGSPPHQQDELVGSKVLKQEKAEKENKKGEGGKQQTCFPNWTRTSLTMSLQPTQKTNIADNLWGDDHADDRQQRLSKFLARCAHERSVLNSLRPQGADYDADIAQIISKIKSEPRISKSQITSGLSGGNIAVVDHVVRMIFMTASKTDNTAGGGYIAFPWKSDEAIADFLDRVYRHVPAGVARDQPINIRNLRGSELMSYAGIRIRPTEKLSDHLHLIYGDDFKTLLVFHHRSFLEYSLERLKADCNDLDQSTTEALKCGCLNPKLLIETLKTFDLLFPPFGDKKSRKFLRHWVDQEKLDAKLLDTKWPINQSEQPPKDLQGLYEQYPYWGRQLAKVLREMDDPTPITWWQKYTERGRSPRRMFECAIAALVVTAFSAFIATALAAVQVWIAYCDWNDAPSRSWCPSRHESST